MWSDSIRFSRAQRTVFYAIFGLLFVTGLVWQGLDSFCDTSHDAIAAAKSLQLKIHGVAGMAALVLIGMILSNHIRQAWPTHRNRPNGISLLGAVAILVVTGYALYYAGGEALRRWSGWIHLAVGLLLPFLILFHVIFGRRSRP